MDSRSVKAKQGREKLKIKLAKKSIKFFEDDAPSVISEVLQNNNGLPLDDMPEDSVIVCKDVTINEERMEIVADLVMSSLEDVPIEGYIIPIKSLSDVVSLDFDENTGETSWIGFEKGKFKGAEDDEKVRIKLTKSSKILDYLFADNSMKSTLSLPLKYFKPHAKREYWVSIYQWHEFKLEDYMKIMGKPRHELYEMNVEKDMSLQLLNALKYLHENGFAHCQVKVDNIYVDVDNHGKPILKLTDFEMSIRFCDNSKDEMKLRSDDYKAAADIICYIYERKEKHILKSRFDDFSQILDDFMAICTNTPICNYQIMRQHILFDNIDTTLIKLLSVASQAKDFSSLPLSKKLKIENFGREALGDKIWIEEFGLIKHRLLIFFRENKRELVMEKGPVALLQAIDYIFEHIDEMPFNEIFMKGEKAVLETFVQTFPTMRRHLFND